MTSGDIEALELICKTFLDPGDVVVVERPTYMGAVQSVRSFEAELVSVPLDEDGLEVDDARRTTAEREQEQTLRSSASIQEPGHARGERGGLPGPGTGHDQQRTFAVVGRGPLRAVQLIPEHTFGSVYLAMVPAGNARRCDREMSPFRPAVGLRRGTDDPMHLHHCRPLRGGGLRAARAHRARGNRPR